MGTVVRASAMGFARVGPVSVAGSSSTGAAAAVAASLAARSSSITCSHFLQRNRVTARPRSFSSATWYFCLQRSQTKFIAQTPLTLLEQ